MPIYEFDARDKFFYDCEQTSFKALGISEEDIEKNLCHWIEMIPDRLLVISNQFQDWDKSLDRMDILCIDPEANFVVVELKRVKSKIMLDQAIEYCALVKDFPFDQIVSSHQKFLDETFPDDRFVAEKEITQFLGIEEESIKKKIGKSVRVILVAPDFSEVIRKKVIFYKDKLSIDIKCMEFQPLDVNNKRLIDVKELIPETGEYVVKVLPPIIPPLAKSKESVIKSLERLNIELPINEKLQERLRQGKHFCVYKKGNKYLFGWSKFAGYDGITVEQYLTQHRLISGSKTESALKKIGGIDKISSKDPLYEKLYKELVKWMKPYDKSPQSGPKSKIGIWLVK